MALPLVFTPNPVETEVPIDHHHQPAVVTISVTTTEENAPTDFQPVHTLHPTTNQTIL
jgi:hypothetical protein